MEDLDLKERLKKVINDIHVKAPHLNINTTEIASYETRGGILNKQTIKRIIIYLRSSGCQWMIDNGGCSMCGHFVGTTRGKKIDSKDYVEQFKKIVSEIDFTETPMLCVYNAGSFLNDNEMPDDARVEIYKIINTIDKVKRVIFESRPEYITEEKINELKEYIKDKEIEIGMGIETSNEFIRDICLNKGFKVDEFKRALKLLKENSIFSLGYILLKPPFINDKFAIEDSVNSIKWAFDNGIDIISLEPVSIQENTLISILHELNLYRTPRIWSVFEVLRRTSNIGTIRVGGFEFFPSPFLCTSNCEKCDSKFLKFIEEYNKTNSINVVNEALDTKCECKKEWLEDLENDNTEIKENINKFLEIYERRNR